MTNRWLSAALVAMTGAPALAAEDGGGGSALIMPDPGLMIWTSVTFLLLLFLLGRFAWKPVLTAISAREKSIEDSLDRAKAEREESAKLLGEHRKLVNQAQRERAQAVEAAQKDAERQRQAILDEARTQREQMIRQAQEQVEASLQQARNELRALAVDLSVQAAGKLLAKNVDDATQRRLVEDYLADLEKRGADRDLPS